MSTSDENSAAAIVVTMIPPDQLDPNLWNPNQLTEAQEAELRAEVSRLRRLPKPVVVRRKGDRFEIVDGEHGWRAAKECGLTEVPCEVVDVDDFTARLETFKRNQHGKHNRVREGQMFREMLQLRKISQRKLAKEFAISDAALRICLDYAKAADLRNAHFQKHGCSPAHYWIVKPDGTRDCYTGDSTTKIDPDHFSHAWGEAEVSGFTVAQLNAYLELPEGLRDRWADAGAHPRDLEPYRSDPNSGTLYDVFESILEMGLADLVSDKNLKFHDSLVYIMSVVDWASRHATIVDISAYLRPVATYHLNVAILDHLPCQRSGRAFQALISAEEWTFILGEAKKHADRRYDLEQLITMGIRGKLKEKNIPLETVLGPVAAEMAAFLETAPAFIQEADHLSLEEKTSLQVALQGLAATQPPEVVLQAAQSTVDEFRRRRTEGSALPPSSMGLEPVDVFNGFVREIVQNRVLATEDKLFADPDKLFKAVVAQVEKFDTNWDREVGGRPARDIFREDLRALPEPVFLLVASLLCSKHPSTAASRWFTAVERLAGSSE